MIDIVVWIYNDQMRFTRYRKLYRILEISHTYIHATHEVVVWWKCS